MGRLATVGPRVGALPAKLKQVESIGRSGFRHLYRTARWQALRRQVLVGANYTCAKCGRVGAEWMVCDHVAGHEAADSEAKFWSGPFQALCKRCHEGAKQREEAAVRRGARG